MTFKWGFYVFYIMLLLSTNNASNNNEIWVFAFYTVVDVVFLTVLLVSRNDGFDVSQSRTEPMFRQHKILRRQVIGESKTRFVCNSFDPCRTTAVVKHIKRPSMPGSAHTRVPSFLASNSHGNVDIFPY